jgi:hypothetical protein
MRAGSGPTEQEIAGPGGLLGQLTKRLVACELIIVRPRDEGGFHLVAGERRWRASGIAGQTTIPALVDDLAGSASSS